MRTKKLKRIIASAKVAAVATVVCLTAASCSQDENVAVPGTRAEVTRVSGVLTGTHNWSGTVYVDGKTFLKNGTINIAAGTRIIGVAKEGDGNASALIITSTGTINAKGTASSPVTFTSEGEGKIWGGLVIMGTGAINQTDKQLVEGIHTSGLPSGITVDDLKYGTPANGKTDEEVYAINSVSSGELHYVRVEYAGQSIGDGNELNAYTFAAVGHNTVVDHCLAYKGEDDAFEFFGGDVNAKYLVSIATDDDAFDFDFGYKGKIQFAVSTIDPSLTYSKDPNGIECDNDGDGTSNKPFTHPVLSNLTIVGTSNGEVAGTTSESKLLKSAADFRRNCGFTLVNSVLGGFPKGIFKETTNADYKLKNNIVSSVPNAGSEYVTFTPDASNTRTAITSVLTSPWTYYNFNSNSLKPVSGGEATSGANFDGLTGFEIVSYKGAINPIGQNWLTQNWVINKK